MTRRERVVRSDDEVPARCGVDDSPSARRRSGLRLLLDEEWAVGERRASPSGGARCGPDSPPGDPVTCGAAEEPDRGGPERLAAGREDVRERMRGLPR